MPAGRSRAQPGWSALTGRLREDGIAVAGVPAKLARRVRLLSAGHDRKSEKADALSAGIAAWPAPALRTAETGNAIAALRAATGHRDDMVCARTQLINRLHAVLVKLVPSGHLSRRDIRPGAIRPEHRCRDRA